MSYNIVPLFFFFPEYGRLVVVWVSHSHAFPSVFLVVMVLLHEPMGSNQTKIVIYHEALICSVFSICPWSRGRNHRPGISNRPGMALLASGGC